MRLDHINHLSAGTKDAVHVPFIVASLDRDIVLNSHSHPELKGGDWVKFTDDTCKYVVPSNKEEGHGIINPFVDEVCWWGIVVLLRPGITTPVQHHFVINPALLVWEKEMLESELRETKENDPGCSDCWVIQDGKITRM